MQSLIDCSLGVVGSLIHKKDLHATSRLGRRVAESLKGRFATLRPCDLVARSQVALDPAGGVSRARDFAANLSLTGKVCGLKGPKLTIRHGHKGLGKRRVTLGFVGNKTNGETQKKTLHPFQQINKTVGRLNNGKKCLRGKHREEKATYREENVPVDLSEQFHGFR